MFHGTIAGGSFTRQATAPADRFSLCEFKGLQSEVSLEMGCVGGL